MHPFIPTSAGGFIGPLKRINHFPLPGLYTSHPLSPHFPFVCVHCAHIASVYECTCVAQVCVYLQCMIVRAHTVHVTLIVYTCMHTAACAQRVSQLPALGAFHVHYHLFYSGIFKSGGLGTAAAIVREQRRALRVSGGCGMWSAELFSKCCTPHFMESQGGWPGQPCRQTELNSTHSCINGSLCAIPPH